MLEGSHWWPKLVTNIFRTLVFKKKKKFKSDISIFCCIVSVGNISLHFQTFILPLIGIIHWDLCLHQESEHSQCSTQRSDLIIIVCLEWLEDTDRTNWDQNQEELWQCLRDASRNLPGKINFWKCKLIFLTDTLQRNIEIIDLKAFFFFT